MRIPFALMIAVPILLAGFLAIPGTSLPGVLPLPTPTYDPLATPALPENPGPADLGREVYYYHCMPCHGDLGQGLTDEFRMVWEEDHQDCWDSGCHGGRERDEGFPIPTIVPAVMGSTDRLPGFTTQEQLFDYIETTHPPQAPGRLTDEQTWQIVALLWSGNGKAASQPTGQLKVATHTPAATPSAPAIPSPTTKPATGRAPLYVCGVQVGLAGLILLMRAKKHQG